MKTERYRNGWYKKNRYWNGWCNLLEEVVTQIQIPIPILETYTLYTI